MIIRIVVTANIDMTAAPTTVMDALASAVTDVMVTEMNAMAATETVLTIGKNTIDRVRDKAITRNT